MRSFPPRPIRAICVAALWSIAWTACARNAGAPQDVPLLDGLSAPRVLVETRRLEPPPANLDGNRYLTGWWPHRRADGMSLTPRRSGARLEVVHLAARERTLVLDSEVREGPAEGTMEIRVAGRSLGRFPVAGRIKVPLPADLPVGQLPVDIVTGEALISVANVGVAPSLPAGRATVDGADLVQAGWSTAEITVPVGGASALAGRLEPPADADPGQVFEVRVRADLEAEESVFTWPGSSWFGDRETFAAPLPADAEWLRVRFVARGEGPPARWTGLALRRPSRSEVTSAPATPPTPAAIPELPRLVVVYVLDALRADFVGHLGGPPGATPTLDRLASEGKTFTHHVSVAPNTLPSTKTLFTGMVFLTRGGWKLPPDGPTTLAERFRRAGRATGLFTGNGNITSAQGLTRGFDHAPRSILFGSYQNERPPFNDNAARVHAAALEWLQGLPEEQPAFLLLQTIHPHNPYDPPDPFRSQFTEGIDSGIDGSTETLRDVQYQRRQTSEADRKRLRALYTGGLSYNDREIDRFLRELARRVPPEELLLVVTSDHGEELFEHGGVLHGWTLYDEQLAIPLIVRWPGHVAPGVIDAPTDNVDLHATLALLADSGRNGGDEPSGGRSLWPVLADGPRPERQVQFAAASSVEGGEFMARSRRYKVIQAPRAGNAWGMGQGLGRDRDVEYVFDLVADPGETVNLAGEDIPEAAWLSGLLDAWVAVGLQLEAGTPLAEMDEETLDSLRALGYVD